MLFFRRSIHSVILCVGMIFVSYGITHSRLSARALEEGDAALGAEFGGVDLEGCASMARLMSPGEPPEGSARGLPFHFGSAVPGAVGAGMGFFPSAAGGGPFAFGGGERSLQGAVGTRSFNRSMSHGKSPLVSWKFTEAKRSRQSPMMIAVLVFSGSTMLPPNPPAATEAARLAKE